MTRYFLWSAAGAVVAIAIGRLLNHRMRGEAFLRMVYVGLVVTKRCCGAGSRGG